MPTEKTVERNDNKLAIAYYRCSSGSRGIASIEQQREAAHNWAEAEGYTVIAEYEDTASLGTTPDRPEYQRMLHEIHVLHPSAVILWRIDRLGRDPFELNSALKTIRDSGCRVCCVAEAVPDDDSLEATFVKSLVPDMPYKPDYVRSAAEPDIVIDDPEKPVERDV